MSHSGTVSPSSQKLDGHDVTGICSKSASQKKSTASNQVLIESDVMIWGLAFFL